LIERVFIEDVEKHGNHVQRPWTITRFDTNNADPDYPVEVDLKNLDSNVTETVQAKYLFSGEGAKSFVREQLKIPIRHKDPISHVWGVMDGVVRTNFPDIKMKCTIHSDHGSIMVIPRENNMVRLYIQIASSTEPDFDPRKTATVQEVQAAAKRIFEPYYCHWDRVEWYSVYPIGQGIAEKYTLDHRVFMGGDVCHTHSPKAGQGMNTAFHDAINAAVDGKPGFLSKIEASDADPAGMKDHCPDSWHVHMDFVRDWVGLEPVLGGVDLRPAVYLARETVPLRIVGSSLSPNARKAVDVLRVAPSLSSMAARDAIKDLDAADRSLVMDRLIAEMRRNPDWSRLRTDFRGAVILADAAPAAATGLARFVRSLPMERLPA
ncbi:MAG: hypothetical protein M1823_006428, partial [Watsoniomyces obsoletus]